MKVIIIDDEKRAQLNLQLLLEEYCPNITLSDSCDNLSEGVKSIRKNKPDVVFLDIEMPGHSGLELLDFFDEDEVHFSIIFTTAYNEYAIQAFKLSALDYLLKPINPGDLVLAVGRLEKEVQKLERFKLLKENLSQEKLAKIAIPIGNSLVFLNIEDIVLVKANGSYSEIVLADGTVHLMSKNLKTVEETLCLNSLFIRVHKSYIVNVSYVESITKSDGGVLELKYGHSVPCSGDKFDVILEKVKIIKR